MTHKLPLLAKGPFRGAALVHLLDAVERGLADGVPAVLTGPQGGRVTVQVQCSDSVMRGVVCVAHGWGHDQPGTQLRLAAQRPGANLNAVLDDRLRDRLSGNAVLTGVAVALQPA